MDAVAQELVDEQIYSWTEMHKKSAVSFLVLSALKDNKMWSKDLESWIRTTTGWNISERSLYRVLRRMQKQGSIQFEAEPVARTGAERKVYAMTPEGKSLLTFFRSPLISTL